MFLTRSFLIAALFGVLPGTAEAQAFLACSADGGPGRASSVFRSDSNRAPCAAGPIFSAERCLARTFEELTAKLSLREGVEPPTLAVINAPEANAYALRPRHIVITRSLLRSIKTRDELRFVLAHELGHLELGHVEAGGARLRHPERSTGSGAGIEIEHAADQFAISLLSGDRVSPRAPAALLRRLVRGSGVYGIMDRCSLSPTDRRIEFLQAYTR